MSSMHSAFKPTLSERLSRGLYSLVLFLILPIVIVALWVASVRSQNRDYFRLAQRFGFVNGAETTKGYWFHCVSVGEVVTASCVIKSLMEKEPYTPFTITTTTATGAARVKALFGSEVRHFYLPFDLGFVMKNMLRRLNPKQVIITEVELWPNLVHTCWQSSVPVCVLNARMTDKSARRYAKFPKLFGAMLKKLSHVCAQGQRDYDNYLYLGIDESKLTLTNNIKFDQAGALLDQNQGQFLNLEKGQRIIVVGGSTHEGEESALLKSISSLSTIPPPLLILVPRHPERFARVANLLQNDSRSWCKTSDTKEIPDNTAVVLVDEMGKLTQVFGVADIAFVGGSLADKGGHNALEPAALSLPIIMGPHTYNNPQICEVLANSGALEIVQDQSGLNKLLNDLVSSAALRQEKGEAGRAILIQNKGAVKNTLEVLKNVTP